MKEQTNNTLCFGIRAQCRMTKKRMIIIRNMSEAEAKAWRPGGHMKRSYRYFRAVNTSNY